MELFRELSEKEVEEFKQWARDNYTTGETINTAYHPVVQEECTLMNVECWYKNSIL